MAIDCKTVLPTIGLFMSVTGTPAFFTLGRTTAGFWCALSGFWACVTLAVVRGRASRPFRVSHSPALSLVAALALASSLVSLVALANYARTPAVPRAGAHAAPGSKADIVSRVIKCVWALVTARAAAVLAYWAVTLRNEAVSEGKSGSHAMLVPGDDSAACPRSLESGAAEALGCGSGAARAVVNGEGGAGCPVAHGGAGGVKGGKGTSLLRSMIGRARCARGATHFAAFTAPAVIGLQCLAVYTSFRIAAGHGCDNVGSLCHSVFAQ